MAPSGNTFDGEIREIPGIYVDSFSYKALDSRYSEKLRYLIVKQYNEPFEVQTFRSPVKVTMLESYHCPGSSMFLFECATSGVSCLATGDIRAEKWWVSSLVKNRFLFPYITGLKQLDQIYLDTTFSYRREPYITIMPNSEGIMALIEFLKLYPVDREIEFSFLDAVSGSEEIWLQVLDHFNGTLDADSSILERVRLLNTNKGQQPTPKLTGPMTFNVGNLYKDVPLMITIKHCIDFNIVDYAGFCLPKRLCDIDTSSLTLLRVSSSGHQIYSYDDKTWLLPLDGKELLPTNLLVMFSRHSSYQESIEFVRLFKPKSVFPCVSTKESWLGGFTVGRVFGQVCSSSEHLFDVENFRKFGQPPRILLERPVSTINRWSFEQCAEEVSFVKNFITEPKAFKGQMQWSQSKPEQELCTQDLKLQSIIAGRGEEKYKQVIDYHKSKDLNLIVSAVHERYNCKVDLDTDTESACSTDYDSDSSATTNNSVVASSCVFEKSFSENQAMPECNFLSPGLNHRKISQISNTIRSDRRSWNSFSLRSVTKKKRKEKHVNRVS
ncbi:hypothetical protein KGF57_000299 [Candida theae]|uniref:Protein artemis n=1 Tax=Candida theae TaxID=1198502 RepID=A0AAD5BJY0_9ASCO|nr:uncharacterized protein KGF57_000299 [Candida theae]KAI5967782.1 hypothetical protein KGF57_000299 [Candida theae]